MKIIGLCGFIDSGKGTVGNILQNEFGFVGESFANPLKDSVSTIFGWPRNLLEGDTKESRIFRETKDEWWSEKLGYDVTPRLILQKMGTEGVRNGIGNSVWLNSLEKRLSPYCQYVITDVRFENEIELIKKLDGYVVEVYRDPQPNWVADYRGHLDENNIFRGVKEAWFQDYYPSIHRSEWDWMGSEMDYCLINNGTLDDLNKKITEMLEYFYIDMAIKQGMVKNYV